MQAQLSNDAVRDHAMVACTQADVDSAFADMEYLLAHDRPAPFARSGGCVNCGGCNFVYNGSTTAYPGSRVCDDCGVVDSANVYWETMYGCLTPTKSSNYKRIHHWHERISQLLLMESAIPPSQMLQIAQKLCDGTYDVLNKDTVRAVLRSLNMQLYIEKWLQIIFRITSIQPPCPGPLVIQQLDMLFNELQRPFEGSKMKGRKNFLNYNYVFCRLFQKIGTPQFSMFFPLIKSPSKLELLDVMWKSMMEQLQWSFTPLLQVAPFAVKLQSPDVLLQRLTQQCVSTIPVEPQIKPLRMVYQKSDRLAPSRPEPKPKPHRSDPLGRELQKLGVSKRRLR